MLWVWGACAKAHRLTPTQASGAIIDGHAGWAQRPGNLAGIGWPDDVREAIRDIPNDYHGPTRKKILLTVMAVGGIRLRGPGGWVAIGFTVDTASAPLACRDVLWQIAGELTLCRFSNLGNGESLESFCRGYERQSGQDVGWILRLAAPSGRKPPGA